MNQLSWVPEGQLAKKGLMRTPIETSSAWPHRILSNLLLQRGFVVCYSICFIERQLVNASRIQSPTHILQIPHQMRFYNNRCKVPPIVPPNPASQNAIFGFYITPLCSTFMNTLNQSVAFKQNKSICWGRGETPSSPPMRRDFSQILDFKFFSPCRSQWPRGLRLRSSAARLLRLWVRIPPGAWMFVCVEKTMRKQAKINRLNRWATPEATIPLAKIKSE